MRLKICCLLENKGFIPFNYNYELQSVIYRLIQNSSPEFSSFLHHQGFVDRNRPFKLFTFSKILCVDGITGRDGLQDVSSFNLLFSSPIKKSYEHLVLGIFLGKHSTLLFPGNRPLKFNVTSVESLPEPGYQSEMRFISLSPIAVSTMTKREDRTVQHYLDYMDPEECNKFKNNLFNNTLKKYRLVEGRGFKGSMDFEFQYDKNYILKRNGRIRKQIRFKKNETTGRYSYIIGMEAPFTIKADPELIKIGYQCGFGEKNSAGFGMAEVIK